MRLLSILRMFSTLIQLVSKVSLFQIIIFNKNIIIPFGDIWRYSYSDNISVRNGLNSFLEITTYVYCFRFGL